MDGRTLARRYDEVLREGQDLRDHCRHLEWELSACRPELYRAHCRIDRLEQRNAKLKHENAVLRQKLADLTAELKHQPQAVPAASPGFVKANVPERATPPKKPGRRPGHAAALRPMPAKIDIHETVPVPIDT